MSFILISAGIGAVMGLIAGLLGVGGGVIAVPAMIYLLNMDAKVAIGTSLAIIVPVALSGSIKQYLLGQVDLKAFVCLSVTGVAFAWLGSHLGHGLDPFWLRRCFAIFLLLVGAKMLFETPKVPDAPVDPPAAVEAEAPR
jgi:uncharacterized protein